MHSGCDDGGDGDRGAGGTGLQLILRVSQHDPSSRTNLVLKDLPDHCGPVVSK